MSLTFPKLPKFTEAVVWAGALGASAALAGGVYSLAGKGFVTTIDDPLALPAELVITSRDANIPLPPQLVGDRAPAVEAAAAQAVTAPSEAVVTPPVPAAGVAPTQPPDRPGQVVPQPAQIPPAQQPVPAQPAPVTAPPPAPATTSPAPAPTPPPTQAPNAPRQLDSRNSNGLVISPTQTVEETTGKLRGITR